MRPEEARDGGARHGRRGGARPEAPATMTSAAPIVGSRAAVPGNGVSTLRMTPATPSRRAPPTRHRGGGGAGSREPRIPTTASSAPIPSSQARVGSE